MGKLPLLTTSSSTQAWKLQLPQSKEEKFLLTNSEGMPGEFDDKFRSEHSDLLENTVALSTINPADYDGIFFSGGHGTCVDFPLGAKAAVEGFWNAGKFVAAVCHGPCCLLEAEVDGAKLLKGRRCTGFSDIEEDAVQLTSLVTEITGGSLATLMKKAGGLYEDNGTMWTANCVRDGRLITGQNPQSSKCAADALIAAIMSKPKVVLAETSADKIGEHATGSWWEEITTPYYQFINA